MVNTATEKTGSPTIGLKNVRSTVELSIPVNKIAKMSELVKDMVDDDYDDTKIQEIPLPNVKAHVLRKVIEFSEHYQSDPLSTIEKPLKSSNIKANLCQELVLNGPKLA